MGVADLIEQAVNSDTAVRRIAVINEPTNHTASIPSRRISYVNNTPSRTTRIRMQEEPMLIVDSDYEQAISFLNQDLFSQMNFEHQPAQTLEEMVIESQEINPIPNIHEDRRELIDVQTTNLPALVRKHSKWLTILSMTGFLGLCLKSPFIYSHFSEKREYSLASSAYEEVVKTYPGINNLIFIDKEGSCSHFINGVNRLQDCSYEGDLVSGSYSLLRNNNDSLRIRTGAIRTSWSSVDVNRSLALINNHNYGNLANNIIPNYSPGSRNQTNSRTNNQTRTQNNRQQNTQQRRSLRARINSTRPTACTFNYLREYGVQSKPGLYCVPFGDGSKICSTRINNYRNNTYYLPKDTSQMFRDMGSDGILGWRASYTNPDLGRQRVSSNSWSRFSASRNQVIQNAYNNRIRGLEEAGRERLGTNCARQ